MAKVKWKKIGVVGVDTSMLLIIDPAYLFSHEEWQSEVVTRAQALGNNYPQAILQALAGYTKRPLDELAVVAEVDGDGVREILRMNGALVLALHEHHARRASLPRPIGIRTLVNRFGVAWKRGRWFFGHIEDS